MARKILNRKELRKQSEAAESSKPKTEKTTAKAAQGEQAGDESEPTKLPRATKRSKTRSKADKEVRLKAFWGVFNQMLRRVALFEYSQRNLAEKKAEELTQSTKTPHFVQLVKDVIEE